MRWITALLCVAGAILWSLGVLLPSEVHYRSDPDRMSFPADLVYKPQGLRYFDKGTSLGQRWQLVGLATLIVGALAPILILVKQQSRLATAATILGVIHGFGFADVVLRSNNSTPSSHSVDIVWPTWFALLLGHIAIFGAIALRNRQAAVLAGKSEA